MSIDFLRPLFLLLLLPLPLLWFLPRRPERRVQAILRTVLLASVVLALSGPVLVSTAGARFDVLVLDLSGSVEGASRERALRVLDQWGNTLEDRDRAAVVVIGPAPASGPLLPGDFRQLIHLQDPVSTSSLSAALAAAERQIPAGSAGLITLASDGLSTDRRWGPVVQRLTARGIPVAVHDLGPGDSRPRLVGLAADPQLRAGQTARIEVTVAGQAGGVRVRISDTQGREWARSEPLTIAGRTRVALEFEPTEAGFLTLIAEAVSDGTASADPARTTLRRTFAVQAPLRLLYLGDRTESGASHLGDLLGRGFQVVDGAARTLNATTDLTGFDLVVIDDRPASLLPEPFQTHLASAVQKDGLGLLFTGGKASFGTGGYDHSTVAGLLPVDFIQRTEKRDPSTALAVIIDTSGSMSGTRIELAKQITRLAIRRLKAHDRVGIVEFYGNKHWALPLQSAANKIAIDRAIGRMQAVGGTVMYPAIEEAFYGLKNVATRYKHILIITDAGVEDADYESLVRLIAKDNINVSTVLVGAQAHSQSLVDIASWGRGRFYAAADRYNLPEVVLKQSTTLNLPAYKSGGFPVIGRGGPGWWGELDRTAVPALAGYVETQTRPGAETVLEVDGSAHPVLASWQYGLGRVTTFMTEPLGEGTAAWKDWNGYGRWLARVVSRTAGDLRPFRFEVTRQDHRLVVQARRYGDRTDAVPVASLMDGAGAGSPLVFHARSADHFVAERVADPIQEVRLRASAGGPRTTAPGAGPGRGEVLLVSPPSDDVASEFQVDPEAAMDLAGLARATGGTYAGPADASAAPRALPLPADANSLSLVELWPYAAGLALLLYLTELAVRRWPSRPATAPVRP